MSVQMDQQNMDQSHGGFNPPFNHFGISFCVHMKNTACSDKSSELWIIQGRDSTLLMRLLHRKCLRTYVRSEAAYSFDVCRAEWRCSSLHSNYPQYWMGFTARPLQLPVTCGTEVGLLLTRQRSISTPANHPARSRSLYWPIPTH
jgi:hypothetical protein